MKIQLYAYTRNNVGDDLFVYSLISEFKNIQFYINIKEEKYAKAFYGLRNLTVSIKNEQPDINDIKDKDACIYIGGSIFMEKGNALKRLYDLSEFVKKCKSKNIPYYFISPNYGPYETKEYFDLSKQIFECCTDICFRDKYSYNLFSDISSVRYAPDYLFSFNFENYIKKQEKDTIGISVIDMDVRPHLKEYEQNYIQFVSNNVINYIKNGKKVSLISFCEYEGDIKGISKIINNLPEEYKNKINTIEYDGNLEKFLNEYAKLEYCLCTRFHSMVISLMMNQKTYTLSYSDKLSNVINDLNLYTNFEKIASIHSNRIVEIDEFSNIMDKDKKEEIQALAKKQAKAICGL